MLPMPLPNDTAQAVPVSTVPKSSNVRLISRDEMNLAEFPLTMLSTRGSPKTKTLEFKDVVKGKNGEVLSRSWIITGADKFGLPTASDDEVLLGLLKLTVDDGVQNRKVFFTRYELLRILRWSTEGRSYSRLQKALDRLSGVRVKTTNGFYDNESKLHSTKNFGIVDAYEINDGRDAAPKSSFFIWSEVLFKSFQVGFIKKLDLDFYLSLQSAVSKRLYRYLDKHFWYRSKVQINLFTLAHEKIGISRNYRFASSIRQQLDPAIEELVKVGFLASAEYAGKGQGSEAIFYAANAKAVVSPVVSPVVASSAANCASLSRRTPPQSSASAGASSSPELARARPTSASGNVLHSDASCAYNKILSGGAASTETVSLALLAEAMLKRLVERGLQEPQAQRLLAHRNEAQLNRVGEIIEHFDYLRSTNSERISRSPIGFLYHAVKNAETFCLPADARKRAALRPQPRSAASRCDAKPAPKGPDPLAAYLVARKQELLRLKGEIEPELMEKIRGEVEAALSKLRAQISAPRFAEAVEHGVEEKLAKLFAFPDFEEWKRQH